MHLLTPSRSFCRNFYSYCRTRAILNAFGITCRAQIRSEDKNVRNFATALGRTMLGIETSCDDTGTAIVDESGQILGEALHSQTALHVEMGGIIPPIARDLHKKHISNIVNTALREASMSVQDVDAIAVTVKPGLSLSLSVGLECAKQLSSQYRKPLIPIHHMEAHALTARLTNRVEFPYLVLLISGGHCLLAVVRDVTDFLLLGKSLDDAPGDALDKTARRLNLKLVPRCAGLSGGRSIEVMAEGGDPTTFDLHPVMSQHPDCNFSFAGLKAWAQRTIEKEEGKYGIVGGGVIPNAPDFCASFQFSLLHHLSRRLQRALLFCELNQLLPADKRRTLVVSGGVASNNFLRGGLEKVCAQYDTDVVCPPARLCTDNGVMIAWNGMELLKAGKGLVEDCGAIDIMPKCPLGVDITDQVLRSNIKLPRLKLREIISASSSVKHSVQPMRQNLCQSGI